MIVKIKIILITACAIFSLNVAAQKYFSVPPLKVYLAFYKNGKSIHKVNDSLQISLYKDSDTLYSVRFFKSGMQLVNCDCIFRGSKKKEVSRIAEQRNGKTELIRREFDISILVLKDPECFNSLPDYFRNQVF